MTRKASFPPLLALLGVVLIGVAPFSRSEGPQPVIDMHLHSYSDTDYFVAPDQFGRMAPSSADTHFTATYDVMRRRNIVLA